MDILKLIFEHDMLFEKLSGVFDARNERERPSTLEEFMKPTPTYSRFYVTGTKLEGPWYGLDQIDHADSAIEAISKAIRGLRFTTTLGHQHSSLLSALKEIPVSEAVVAHKDDLDGAVSELSVSEGEQLRDRIPSMLKFLDRNYHVIYKEKALNGFDLHIFSRLNLYGALFYALRPLIGPGLRFFSINGKRMTSERFFYFETHRLDNPPHGFEEVFPQTVV